MTNINRETIVLDGIKFHRYCDSNCRTLREYYSWCIKQKKIRLHRYIYEKEFGEIPKWYVVHHIDGNSRNNDIFNLTVIDRSTHSRKHALEENRVKESRESIKKAQKYACKWHSSEEWKIFHKKLWKIAWEKRIWHKKNCEVCGKEYETAYKERSKFCHPNCRATHMRRKKAMFAISISCI